MPIPNLIRKTKRADDYKPVPISETDVEKHLETVPTTQNPTIHFRPPSLPSLLLAILVFSTTYLAILLVWPSSTAKPLPCNHIATRREWRTLSLAEKESYIKAVKCLKTRPSKLELNQTLYDDFPWVHSRVGERGGYVRCLFRGLRLPFMELYLRLTDDIQFTTPHPF